MSEEGERITIFLVVAAVMFFIISLFYRMYGKEEKSKNYLYLSIFLLIVALLINGEFLSAALISYSL
jgi:hypothetical protein